MGRFYLSCVTNTPRWNTFWKAELTTQYSTQGNQVRLVYTVISTAAVNPCHRDINTPFPSHNHSFSSLTAWEKSKGDPLVGVRRSKDDDSVAISEPYFNRHLWTCSILGWGSRKKIIDVEAGREINDSEHWVGCWQTTNRTWLQLCSHSTYRSILRRTIL